MPIFRYKAKTMDGREEKGDIEAGSREDAIHRLRQEGLYASEVKEKDAVKTSEGKMKFKTKKIANFCTQMKAMLIAGISIAQALDICRENAGDKKTKAVLQKVSEEVQTGQSLSQAMQGLGGVFPPLLTYMIETGEASGMLDSIMAKMTHHYEQEVKLNAKVRSALIYPTILAVISLFATIFMLTYVVPAFTQMYASMELPAITQFLLDASEFLKVYWLQLIMGMLVVIGIFMWLMTQPSFCLKIDELVLNLPVVGKLIRTVYTSRFASTFAVLYGSGIDVLKCLDIASKVLGNTYVRQQLQEASAKLRTGDMLSSVLRDTGVFQTIFISMVVVGEESGSLDQVLADTGEFFEQEANNAISQMVALLEPMMIIVMGAIIGTIVLAIMLPMFKMYGEMI